MTETIAPPTAAVPAGTSILATDQIASARETWVSLGYDAAAFDIAANGAPEAPGAAPEANTPDRPVLSPLKTPEVGLVQARELAEALAAAGVPQDQIDAALRADGLDPAAVDDRTDDQRDWDGAFAGAEPSEYHADYRDRVPAGADIAAIAQLNQMATGWASEIGFPAEIGAAVIERDLDVGQMVRRMDTPARTLYKREQASLLENMAGGPEQASAKLTLAAKALARAGHTFTDVLHTSGALDDAGLVLHLALQGERLAARG